MRVRIAVIFAFVFSVVPILLGQGEALSGEWVLELRQLDFSNRIAWTLVHHPDGRLTGNTPAGRLLEGNVKGRTVRIEQIVPSTKRRAVFTGTITGEGLAGTSTDLNGTEWTWVATRRPSLVGYTPRTHRYEPQTFVALLGRAGSSEHSRWRHRANVVAER